MKIKNIYKLFALMVLFVSLQSRSNGPGGTANLQVTGAPGSGGSQGTCANTGCHVAGSFSPTASIELLDGSEVVTAYQPGKTYNVKVSINAGNGNPARYGFQAVALNGTNNQSGTWGNVGVGRQKVTLGGREYVEHSSPSTSSSFELEWVAPNAGTGNVTFYSAGIASNNNGGTSGDGTARTSLTVAEDNVSSVIESDDQSTLLKVWPNPVAEVLNLEVNNLKAGEHQVNIFDVAGKVVHSAALHFQSGEEVARIEVAHLQPGLYIVQLYGDSPLGAVQMLKQ